MSRAVIWLTVAATAATVSLLGGVYATRTDAAGAGPTSAVAQPASPRTSDRSVTLVADLEQAARGGAATPEDLTRLGLAYQQRWLQTGDSSYLPRSEQALRQALAIRPNDATTVVGLGSLALTQHRFRLALARGREAQMLAPTTAPPHGVVGDALIELGRYTEAFTAFERMVALKPGFGSYSRISYARELTGDSAGAIAAMRLALDAAGGQPEATAWAAVQLGKLEFGRGKIVAADRYARQALSIVPGYVYALELQARIAAARGDTGSAVELARRVSETMPLAQFVALHGDLLSSQGRTAEAMRQQATVAAIDRLLVAGGVSVDLESAVYRADHLIRPARNVELARKARAGRPSIYGDDALAWALARAGRCGEAVTWSERSLRLGTRDALLWFHRGYAAGCAGDKVGMKEWYAKAIALNPNFSVRFAPLARKALA